MYLVGVAVPTLSVWMYRVGMVVPLNIPQLYVESGSTRKISDLDPEKVI
jgi:hypothetical protein